MLLVKFILKRLITLESNEYTVLFTDQIFINSLSQNIRPSICFQTRDQAFQILSLDFKTFGRAFEAFRENQKLIECSKSLAKSFKNLAKFGLVFVLQRGPG